MMWSTAQHSAGAKPAQACVCVLVTAPQARKHVQGTLGPAGSQPAEHVFAKQCADCGTSVGHERKPALCRCMMRPLACSVARVRLAQVIPLLCAAP